MRKFKKYTSAIRILGNFITTRRSELGNFITAFTQRNGRKERFSIDALRANGSECILIHGCFNDPRKLVFNNSREPSDLSTANFIAAASMVRYAVAVKCNIRYEDG